MSYAPSRRFGIELSGFNVFDLNEEYAINTNEFNSKGRCTPYENKQVFGRCIANISGAEIVHLDKNFLT